MRISGPARRDVVAIDHDKRRTGILRRVAGQAATLQTCIRRVRIDIEEIGRISQRAGDFGLHAAMAVRLARRFEIGAVVVAIPPTAGLPAAKKAATACCNRALSRYGRMPWA